MKTANHPQRIRFLCAGILATAACAGGDSRPIAPAAPLRDSGPSPTAAVDLIVRGVDAQAYDSVLLAVQEVSVRADGAATSVVLHETALGLASGSPVVAASFSIPSSASSVDVSITLAPAGTWEGVGGAGGIDARTLPISFRAPATSVLQRRAIEIELDVTSSLEAVGTGGRALLPDFAIRY